MRSVDLDISAAESLLLFGFLGLKEWGKLGCCCFGGAGGCFEGASGADFPKTRLQWRGRKHMGVVGNGME